MSTLARSSFTALPDLKPGGQNLLVHARVDGNNWNIGSGSTIAVENTDHGKALKVVVGAETASGVNGKTNFATSQTDALVPDTWYCWSFWIKSSVAIPDIGPSKVLHMQCCKSGEFSEANIHQETNGLYFPKAVTANVWTQMHVQFQVKAKATFTPYIWYLPPNSTVYLKDFKLEEGTIPSGWSPGLLDSSVTSVTGHYCLSTSTSAPADSSFSTTMPTNWGSNTYMWAYETHNYGDGSSVNTPKHIVAVKGATGAAGTNGTNGTSAGFGTPTASVDANIGTPSVTVTASGANTAKVFDFAFKNLKGDKGDKGDTARWTGLEYFHTGGGTSGTDGWVKLLQFKVTGTYQNVPLMLSLARRGDPVPIFVSIQFQSANTADPGLQNFKATSNTDDVRLVKSAASTWDLWVQKSERYDNVAVLRIYKAPYLAGIEVTKKNVQETPPTTNAYTPSLWGYSLPLPVNNLTSTSTTDYLSAAQGKILLDKINDSSVTAARDDNGNLLVISNGTQTTIPVGFPVTKPDSGKSATFMNGRKRAELFLVRNSTSATMTACVLGLSFADGSTEKISLGTPYVNTDVNSYYSVKVELIPEANYVWSSDGGAIRITDSNNVNRIIITDKTVTSAIIEDTSGQQFYNSGFSYYIGYY